jgi:hypothetical protein
VNLKLQEVRAQVALLEPRVLAFAESQQAFAFRPQELEAVAEEFVAAVEPVVESELAASVGQASAKGLPWQDALPYVVGGGVLAFLLFGNPNAVLSFLQRRLSKVG